MLACTELLAACSRSRWSAWPAYSQWSRRSPKHFPADRVVPEPTGRIGEQLDFDSVKPELPGLRVVH